MSIYVRSISSWDRILSVRLNIGVLEDQAIRPCYRGMMLSRIYEEDIGIRLASLVAS